MPRLKWFRVVRNGAGDVCECVQATCVTKATEEYLMRLCGQGYAMRVLSPLLAVVYRCLETAVGMSMVIDYRVEMLPRERG